LKDKNNEKHQGYHIKSATDSYKKPQQFAEARMSEFIILKIHGCIIILSINKEL
jgi:hypothetical protein